MTDKQIVDMAHWREDCQKDALTWARDVKGITDQEVLDAYHAGHTQGWQDAVGVATLHGIIK